MATLSITLSQLSPNVKAVHTGVVAVAAAQTLQAASSASSVFKLCQVPNGATLVDWWLSIGGSQAGQVLKLGTSQTPSGIMAATSLSLTLSISTQAAAPSQRGVFNQGYLRAPGAGRGSAIASSAAQAMSQMSSRRFSISSRSPCPTPQPNSLPASESCRSSMWIRTWRR